MQGLNVMHKILIVSLLTVSSGLFAHSWYCIDDFSDNYYARLTIKQQASEHGTQKGTISVWSAKDDSKVFSTDLEQFKIDLSQKSKDSIRYPYAKQRVLIYNDFNFDGKKDIAIQKEMNGCYQGPSYQIFLKEGQTFKWNKDFTRLAQGPYCGMFEVNSLKKQLKTSYKSGCCLHSTTTYEVKNNIPTAVNEIIEQYDPGTKTKTVTSKKWVDGKILSTQKKVINP